MLKSASGMIKNKIDITLGKSVSGAEREALAYLIYYPDKQLKNLRMKDELSDAEKAAVKAGIKEGLEGLAGKIPGLVEVHVNINGLPSSTADLMLDTTFESAEALKGYSVHPAHVAVADGKVRPYTKARFCLDYEV